MSESKLPKSLEEDIELISELEFVEIKKLEDSLYDNDLEYEDESQGIQFEDSSQGSEDIKYKFEVQILLKDCVYAICKKKDCVVTLLIELSDNQEYPLIEVCNISNSSVKLRSKCEYYFNHLAFSRSSSSNYSVYKLIVDFQSFLQFESKNADLHPISEASSNVDDFITLSISSVNDDSATPSSMQYLSNNPYNDYYKKVSSYNERFRDTTRYNSMTISRKDQIYNHLTTHSRYFREFKEEAVLGSGSFGCVTKVLRNGINYAVKQIPIYESYESILHEEAAVLASLQHPNIVRYYDAWLEQSPEYLINKFKLENVNCNLNDQFIKTNTMKLNDDLVIEEELNEKDRLDGGNEYNMNVNILENDNRNNKEKDNKYYEEDKRSVVKIYNKHHKKNKHNVPKKCLFILMEYCGEESLFEIINKHTLHETPQKVIELFRQIMEALSYIHEKGIIHRDVKPSNLFLKFENEFLIKLGDFGLTAKLQQSKGDKSIVNENGVVGTLHYMAPEQLECDAYNEKVDIYSAGVVLFEMLCKPFHTFMERCEILTSFSTPNKQWPEGFRERIDNRLFKLLEAMLNINPNKRPSASEILQNEIFTSNKLNLQSLYTVITQYPHSMESIQLLNTIFSRKQQYKKVTDYYNTVTSNNVINYVNLELGSIYDKEFKSRNVHKIHLSLLTHLPYTFSNTNDSNNNSNINTDRNNNNRNKRETEEKEDEYREKEELREDSDNKENEEKENKNKDKENDNRNNKEKEINKTKQDKKEVNKIERIEKMVSLVSNKNKEVGNSVDKLLLNNGRCCYLRYSLLYSMSECIPKELITVLRRYAYLPVYSSSNGGNLSGRIEGKNINYYLGYDIIADYSIILNENNDEEINLDAFFTYELISVSSRPLKRFINCTLILEWSHFDLISKILYFLKIPKNLIKKLEDLLLSENPIKGRLAGLSDEATSVVAILHTYLHKFKGRVSEFVKGLESLFDLPLNQELNLYFKNLKFFEKFLSDFEGTYQFNPSYKGLSNNYGYWDQVYQYYQSEIGVEKYDREDKDNKEKEVNNSSRDNKNKKEKDKENKEYDRDGMFEKYYFRIILEVGKRNFGELIFGGCYNKIIENKDIRKRNAFGFEMNLQPIYDYFTQNMVNKNLYNNLHLNYAPEVVVYTPQINLITVVTRLENKFWNMGVKCYKKVGGQLNIKRITRLKKVGLFSLQKLNYLITIKKSTETHEIQYIIVDINLENKDVSNR